MSWFKSLTLNKSTEAKSEISFPDDKALERDIQYDSITTWPSKCFLYVGQKARNDLFLKSSGVLFQSHVAVYFTDLRFRDILDEVVVRLLLVAILVG